MLEKILTKIKHEITDDLDVEFIKQIVSQNPVTFISLKTRPKIKSIINGKDNSYYNLHFVSRLTSILEHNEDVRQFIYEFVLNYLKAISSINSDSLGLFFNDDDVEFINDKNNFYYVVLYFINLNFKNNIKKHKGK